MTAKKQSIAIIGAGVAGLTAGYLLSQKHDVYVFEKSDRLGGNAYTFTAKDGEEVDIAVAAFGKAGYPKFYKLLKMLDIKTKLCLSSYMSFQNLDTGQGMYMTPSLKGLLAQNFSIMSPRSIMVVLNLFKGVSHGLKLLDLDKLKSVTMKDALKLIPELDGDSKVIFLCSLCLLSSMSTNQIMEAPASFFFEKLRIHNDVISPKAVYSVRAVTNKTKSYITALAKPIRENIQMNSQIKTVLRNKDGITILFADGKKQNFDKVIFACPADRAIKLIESPSQLEQKLLGAWSYKEGRVVVHQDHSAFPAKELMQAYTFLYTNRDGVFDTSVSGGLWYEPNVQNSCNLISSQHPNFPIEPDTIQLDTILRTPIFDFDSCATTKQLPSLNGHENTYFCGSHFGHGLHEDAVSSAVDVAAQLGVEF